MNLYKLHFLDTDRMELEIDTAPSANIVRTFDSDNGLLVLCWIPEWSEQETFREAVRI